MRSNTATRVVRLTFLACAWLLIFSSNLNAERLPVKAYTTGDGLPANNINRIKRDSRGFLWFCTRDGLSKFDGYQFTNYGKEQGLPHSNINDLLEARDGRYWAATNGGGVCRFNPSERLVSHSTPRFTVYSLDANPISNLANRLCEDREGRLWVGTDQGVFYFDNSQERFIAAIPDAVDVYSLMADRQGALWIGTGSQLWRRSADGQLVRYSFQPANRLSRRRARQPVDWAL